MLQWKDAEISREDSDHRKNRDQQGIEGKGSLFL